MTTLSTCPLLPLIWSIIGTVHTLAKYLTANLPLLFPAGKPPLAYALVQGVHAPPDAEMAWLGACMAGADGWVNVCVGILRDNHHRF